MPSAHFSQPTSSPPLPPNANLSNAHCTLHSQSHSTAISATWPSNSACLTTQSPQFSSHSPIHSTSLPAFLPGCTAHWSSPSKSSPKDSSKTSKTPYHPRRFTWLWPDSLKNSSGFQKSFLKGFWFIFLGLFRFSWWTPLSFNTQWSCTFLWFHSCIRRFTWWSFFWYRGVIFRFFHLLIRVQNVLIVRW